MNKRIGMAFATGTVFGAALLTAAGGHAAQSTPQVPYGYQAIVVSQHTSLLEAPYCKVMERQRIVYKKFDGTKVRRGPWSAWKTTDVGPPAPATDGTICAVQH